MLLVDFLEFSQFPYKEIKSNDSCGQSLHMGISRGNVPDGKRQYIKVTAIAANIAVTLLYEAPLEHLQFS